MKLRTLEPPAVQTEAPQPSLTSYTHPSPCPQNHWIQSCHWGPALSQQVTVWGIKAGSKRSNISILLKEKIGPVYCITPVNTEKPTDREGKKEDY